MTKKTQIDWSHRLNANSLGIDQTEKTGMNSVAVNGLCVNGLNVNGLSVNGIGASLPSAENSAQPIASLIGLGHRSLK